MNRAKQNPGSDAGSALAALAVKEGRALERALAQRKERQDGIHKARKASRRLRSLLTFLLSASNRRSASLDKRLKKLAGGLSSLRDAHMAARTARLLAATHQAALAPPVLDALEERGKALLQSALEGDPDWRHRRVDAQRIVIAIARLPWTRIHTDEMKNALQRGGRRVKKAKQKACAERSEAAYHRWRRRARKLRYQLEFVHKIGHAMNLKKNRAKRYDDRLKDLRLTVDRLGWRQDFYVFLAAVDQLPATAEVVASRDALHKKSPSLSETSPPTPKSRLDRAFVAHGSHASAHASAQ
jgi:CHAD domain-containing protein